MRIDDLDWEARVIAAQTRRQRDRGTSLPLVVNGTDCALVPERRPAKRAVVAVLVAVVALALVSCAAQLKPAALPPKSPVPSAPAPNPSPTESAQQQVMVTMVGFNAALVQAEKSKDAAQARALLTPYFTAAMVNSFVTQLAYLWSHGQIFYGDIISHVLRVTVDGASAVAYDCDDTSRTGREYTATGQVVPGTQGVPHLNLDTQMSLDGDHWIIASQKVADEPCQP